MNMRFEPLWVVHLCLPVFLVMSYALVVLYRFELAWHWWGVTALLAGTGFMYLGDRFLEHRRDWSRAAHVLALSLLVVLGLTQALAVFQASKLLIPMAVLAAMGLGYPWIQRLSALKVLWVAGAFTVAISHLPFQQPFVLWPYLLWIGATVASGTVLCDLKDMEMEQGGIVARLGTGLTVLLAWGLALAAGLCAGDKWFWILPVALCVVACIPAYLQRGFQSAVIVDAAMVLALVLHMYLWRWAQ